MADCGLTREGSRLQLVLPAQPESLRPIRSILLQFADTLGADHETRNALAVAVNEATTNSVLHAYARGSGTVSISASAAARRIVITVSDEGRGEDAPPRRGSENGRGLPLIRALAERVEFRRTPRGSVTQMTFPILGAPSL